MLKNALTAGRKPTIAITSQLELARATRME